MSQEIIEKKCVKCGKWYEEITKQNDYVYDETEGGQVIIWNKCKSCDYNEKLYLWQTGRGYYPE